MNLSESKDFLVSTASLKEVRVFSRDVFEKINLPQDQKDALTSQIPMGRLGAADEVAKAVLFLAGDGGSYITGQTLHVNGGMYTV